MTESDDIDANPDLQLIVDGSDTGNPQMSTMFTLTEYMVEPGVYDIAIRVTDNQENSTTSETQSYENGTPIFTDDSSDSSNWIGDISVSNNQGYVAAAGSARTNIDIWNDDSVARLFISVRDDDTSGEFVASNI